MKKIFSLFAAVMMAATMFAGRTFTAGEKLYMDCGAVGWWCNDDLEQKMFFVTAGNDTAAVSGVKYAEAGEKVFEFAVPAGTYEYLYEQRVPWNRTGNISLTGTEGKNFIKSFSENGTEASWGNIGDAPDPEVTFYLYVTDGKPEWEALYVYAWGAKDIFGAWPGVNVREAEKVDGKYKLAMTAKEGAAINLIFNNGKDGGSEGAEQFDSDGFNLTEDHYVVAGEATALENTVIATKAIKVIENGQIVIIRDGIRYNAVGTQL